MSHRPPLRALSMQASTTGAGAGGAGPASPEYASVRSSVQLSADLSNDLAFLESLRASVRANLIVRPLEGGRPLSFASESTTSPTDSMYFTPTSATFSTYSHASDTDREDDGEEESEREAEREKAEEYEPFMLSAQSIARGLYVDTARQTRLCLSSTTTTSLEHSALPLIYTFNFSSHDMSSATYNFGLCFKRWSAGALRHSPAICSTTQRLPRVKMRLTISSPKGARSPSSAQSGHPPAGVAYICPN